MILSQNVLFNASVEEDPSTHPPGEQLARQLAAKLKDGGLTVCNFENWRDCGWSIDLIHRDAPFQITLASAYEDGWMAQVASTNQPGLIARLFGAKLTDNSRELFELALSVHQALTEISCSDLRWKVDGYPDETSTSKPVQSAR